MAKQSPTLRVAAMADIHYRAQASESFADTFAQIADEADVLLLCGDLTDYGLPEEAHVVAKELAMVRIPIAAVLGNHDYQSGHETEVRNILRDAGVHMLDGESVEIKGVGFAGVKGFAGGFGTRTLEPWGETAIKNFVKEALDETLKLELALARLRTPQKIALLHYSPIQATVEGEPLEIYPFLGSSRLEEPLNRYGVFAAFHGHAHRGALKGQTSSGAPVYNVSASLLRRMLPDKPPFHLIQVPING